MNLCSDHSWAGQGECPKCETAFAGLTPAAPAPPRAAAKPQPIGWVDEAKLPALSTPVMDWLPLWNRPVGADPVAVYLTAGATQTTYELQRRLAAGEKQDAELLTLLQGAVTLIDRNFHDDRAAQLWLSAARSALLGSVGVAA